MSRSRVAVLLAVILAVASTYSLRADVRADEKSHVEFAGALGRVINFFGGKAAREGVESTVAVKGDRMARMLENSGQIIDLGEEKVYDLDLKKKTYKVTTFEELRRQMEEAQQRAAENAQKEQTPAEKQAEQPQKPEKEVEVDLDVKNTGQTRAINGFDTKETIVTVTVREKGKTLEQGGGLVLTSDLWMAPTIASMREIADFERRYAEKLGGPDVVGASAEQMAAALAMYPTMKDAMAKMRTEGGSLEGTPILTTVTMDAVKSAEQLEQEKTQSQSSDNEPSASGGVGGMLGGFARRMAKKKAAPSDEAGPKARTTFMTITNEVLKVSPSVSAAELAVPAGFKLK